jgi:SAM-dependent methyltransferase
VTGSDLLHLQCHFGMDTISWARLGARVTGVDFEPNTIEAARALAAEVGVDARFVCSTVDDLPDALDGRFDIVFTSYGVLMWLPDLDRWAGVVAHFLRPGGRFHLVELHPVVGALSNDPEPRVQPWYFIGGPHRWEGDEDYADPTHRLEHPQYEWVHPVGDVVSALVRAGLVLESLREHPVAPETMRRYMVPSNDDPPSWRIPGDPIPLTYSVVARKP